MEYDKKRAIQKENNMSGVYGKDVNIAKLLKELEN